MCDLLLEGRSRCNSNYNGLCSNIVESVWMRCFSNTNSKCDRHNVAQEGTWTQIPKWRLCRTTITTFHSGKSPPGNRFPNRSAVCPPAIKNRKNHPNIGRQLQIRGDKVQGQWHNSGKGRRIGIGSSGVAGTAPKSRTNGVGAFYFNLQHYLRQDARTIKSTSTGVLPTIRSHSVIFA